MKMSRVSDNFPVPGVSVLCFILNSVHLWTPPVLHQWWILFTMVEGYVMNPWTSGTRALKQKCVMCWRQTSVISGLPVASPQNVVARDNCLWKRKGLILLVEGSGMDGCAGTMQTREHGVMGPVRYSCPFLHHPVSWMIIFSLAYNVKAWRVRLKQTKHFIKVLLTYWDVEDDIFLKIKTNLKEMI